MRIESLSSAHFAQATDLWEQSVRASHHFLIEQDIAVLRPLILNEYLKSVELRGAMDRGRLCGFVGINDRKIEMLFVDPDQMGKGIGSALLKHAVYTMGAVKVDVNEQNEKAHSFYKKFGFVDVRRSEVDGLGKPYPIVHMQLEE